MSKAAQKKKKKRSTEELLETPLFAGVILPLVHSIYAAVIAAVKRMSPEHAYLLARFLGWLGWCLSKRTRNTALRNLEIAFPNQHSDKERRRIASRSLQHFVCTLFDVYLLPPFWESGNWRSILELTPEQEAVLAHLNANPEGVAFQSAHIGSWEFGMGSISKLGKPMTVIYRPLVIKSIDEDFARHRAASGSHVAPKAGALRVMAKTLKQGGRIAILSDQNAGAWAPYLNFCGVPASSQVEHMPIYGRVNARIVSIFVIRDGFKFRFKFRGLAEERFDRNADAKEEMCRVGQWYFDEVEAAIREFPEQYLWVHRRYAHRPKGAENLYNKLGSPLDMAALEAQPKAPIVSQ